MCSPSTAPLYLGALSGRSAHTPCGYDGRQYETRLACTAGVYGDIRSRCAYNLRRPARARHPRRPREALRAHLRSHWSPLARRPCLLLHTVGAKSGLARTNSLTYALDRRAYVVVASAGGGPRNPSWYHNVLANPQVVAQVGTRRVPVTARVAVPADAEYRQLWELVNVNNKQRYAAYQRVTPRLIPIVVISLV
jgi:F420H(2)-dependent quinone reductase